MKTMLRFLLLLLLLLPGIAFASVTLKSSASGKNATAFTGTIPITTPSNASGDVIVLVVSDSQALGTITWPSGFTQVAVLAPPASPFTYGVGMALAWKVSGGSEPASYSISESGIGHATAWCLVYTGASATQFVTSGTDWSTIASNGGNSPVTITAPAITPGSGDALGFVASWAISSADASTYTYPTVNQGTLSLVGSIQSVGNLQALRAASLDSGSSGTTGTASEVQTGQSAAGSAFFFRIASAGGASCTHSGITSAGAIATPNGSSGSYQGKAGGFVTPDCSTINYKQPTVGAFGVN